MFLAGRSFFIEKRNDVTVRRRGRSLVGMDDAENGVAVAGEVFEQPPNPLLTLPNPS
jgi:hypothetical protein